MAHSPTMCVCVRVCFSCDDFPLKTRTQSAHNNIKLIAFTFHIALYAIYERTLAHCGLQNKYRRVLWHSLLFSSLSVVSAVAGNFDIYNR